MAMVHLPVICLFLHCKSVASLVVAGLESDQTLLPTLSPFSKAGKFCGRNPCVCSELRRAKNFTIAIAAKITSNEAHTSTVAMLFLRRSTRQAVVHQPAVTGTRPPVNYLGKEALSQACAVRLPILPKTADWDVMPNDALR
jgi:hypothetical protein